jgi:hypothetical protein
MQEREFLALDRVQRIDVLRNIGEYLGSRPYGSHRVHLYRMEGYFCEVWIRLGYGGVEWVEVARDTDILAEYVTIDPGSLLERF